MRTIQATAIILWGFIFIVAAFFLGQYLASKGILDMTSFITGSKKVEEHSNNINIDQQDDELKNDVVINKVGQETVRIGQNIAKKYFASYYKEYVNYIIKSDKYKVNEKISITSDLASDYVFFAVSNKIDDTKYVSNDIEDSIYISEGEINTFADKMFAQSISTEYKNTNGYDKQTKTYHVKKSDATESYVQELSKIENITANKISLEFDCKKVETNNNKTEVLDEKIVSIYAVYRGGRYIVTEIEKNEK